MDVSLDIISWASLRSPHEDGKNHFVCYAKVNSIPDELGDWGNINPEYHLGSVDNAIIDTLLENPTMMHVLSNGLLISAEDAVVTVPSGSINTKVVISLNDHTAHGLYDGCRTFMAIRAVGANKMLSDNCFVKVEVLTGLTPDEFSGLTSCRNQTANK